MSRRLPTRFSFHALRLAASDDRQRNRWRERKKDKKTKHDRSGESRRATKINIWEMNRKYHRSEI